MEITGPIVWNMEKYFRESRMRGICNKNEGRLAELVTSYSGTAF
jgi:hypothetical protein